MNSLKFRAVRVHVDFGTRSLGGAIHRLLCNWVLYLPGCNTQVSSQTGHIGAIVDPMGAPFLDGLYQRGGVIGEVAVLQRSVVRPRVDKMVDSWEGWRDRERIYSSAFKVCAAQVVHPGSCSKKWSWRKINHRDA
jgi:hypothetical protein